MSQTQYLKQITFLFLFSLLAFLCTNSKKLKSKKDPINDFLNDNTQADFQAKEKSLQAIKDAAYAKYEITGSLDDLHAFFQAEDNFFDVAFNPPPLPDVSKVMAEVFGQANSILAGSSFIEEGGRNSISNQETPDDENSKKPRKSEKTRTNNVNAKKTEGNDSKSTKNEKKKHKKPKKNHAKTSETE